MLSVVKNWPHSRRWLSWIDYKVVVGVVKEIVGGYGYLDPKNMFASWYIFIENLIYSLSNIYKYWEYTYIDQQHERSGVSWH